MILRNTSAGALTMNGKVFLSSCLVPVCYMLIQVCSIWDGVIAASESHTYKTRLVTHRWFWWCPNPPEPWTRIWNCPHRHILLWGFGWVRDWMIAGECDNLMEMSGPLLDHPGGQGNGGVSGCGQIRELGALWTCHHGSCSHLRNNFASWVMVMPPEIGIGMKMNLLYNVCQYLNGTISHNWSSSVMAYFIKLNNRLDSHARAIILLLLSDPFSLICEKLKYLCNFLPGLSPEMELSRAV
jgi:hypothetical protein